MSKKSAKWKGTSPTTMRNRSLKKLKTAKEKRMFSMGYK